MLLWPKILFKCKQLIGRTNQLESIIHLPIVDKKIYDEALSHIGGGKGYERLEFLGDSILQTIISEFLYNQFPEMKEGKLTQIRSKLVRRSALNLLGYRIGLGELITSDYLSFDKIDQSNQRIFGDSLEALIGAVYLDHGYNGAYYFVINKLLKRYVNLDTLNENATNHKGILMELSQKMNFRVRYNLIENQPNRNKVILSINDQPIISAVAKTRKKAEQKAAKKVLNSPHLDSYFSILSKEEE